MKREIKYRAWNGEMLSEPFTPMELINTDTGLIDKNGISVWWEGYPFYWMQFTGLHDKNGKEIYEGYSLKGTFNIVTGERVSYHKRTRHTYNVYGNVEATGCCVFRESSGAFWFDCDYKHEYMTGFWRGIGRTNSERKANEQRPTFSKISDYLWKVNTIVEVVGSVYENPELLKQPSPPQE